MFVWSKPGKATGQSTGKVGWKRPWERFLVFPEGASKLGRRITLSGSRSGRQSSLIEASRSMIRLNKSQKGDGL